jgi:uracil-DNA glycosylase
VNSWKEVFDTQKDEAYMKSLKDGLKQERSKYNVYPSNDDVFNAFRSTPFDKVKVVLLGQDPYYNPGQAHGLAFSVKKGVIIPPSLVNIYQELKDDIKFEIPNHGNLTEWTDQGVLLLNSILTVRQGVSSSHMSLGWMNLTDAAIKALSDHRKGIVFVLWGNFAKAKKPLIDQDKHYVLEAAHPSPRSASRGFFGCKHFSKINQILEQEANGFIDWKITNIGDDTNTETEKDIH